MKDKKMGKIKGKMKSESYDVYDIDFKKEYYNGKLTDNIIAIGYYGGRQASQPIILSKGKTKSDAF